MEGQTRTEQRAGMEMRHELPYSHRFIRLQVRDGRAFLEGEVEWPWQRERAEAAARRASGVQEVSNLLCVRPSVSAEEIRRRMEEEGMRRRAAA